MAKGEEKNNFKLPAKKTVTILPIARGNNMIKDPKHAGYFMLPDTEATFTLPRYLANNNFVKCLTDEEKEFLEAELQCDLSFRKNNEFWPKRVVKIQRTESLLITGQQLDVSSADGYLDWKILSVQACFCKSWAERNDSMEYRFALVEDNEVQEEESLSAQIKQEAFTHFEKIKTSQKKIYDFLVMYGKQPSRTATVDFLRTELWKILDNTPEKYLKIASDVNYEMKVFINDGLTAGGLKLSGRTTYCLGYGSEDPIGRTLEDAINYLKDKKNSATILEIQARIDTFNKK